MVMRLISAVLCVSGAAGMEHAPAVEGFQVPATAAPPFTYCIWYLPDPQAGSFLEDVAASPPDLFHIGYHIPFKGHLGPTYGHELWTNDILPPEEVPREAERVQGLVVKMHEAGVTTFIPYVYTMAFFGRPDERTGFFNFYDHWDAYRSFGLGPKPAADPALWSQVRGPNQLGGGPPGILHYEPCVNHPGWSDYLDLVVRQLASAGYDGMFFDVNTLYCYCPHCEEKFDIYLLRKYGRDALRTCFGTDDHRALNLSTVYRDFETCILEGFPRFLESRWDSENLADTLDRKTPDGLALDEDWRLLRCYMQHSAAEYPPSAGFDAYLRRCFGGVAASAIPEGAREAFSQTVLRRQFRAYLESPELAATLMERFGSADIPRRCCGAPREMLLWVETQRFWCDSIAALFARLKGVGGAVLRDQGRDTGFYTVANLGAMATLDAFNKRRVDGINLVQWAPDADLMMFEEMQQPGVLENGVILSNALAFRWAMGAGTRGGTLLYKVADDTAADLANAEAAAGGGGAFLQSGLDAPESRKRWKRFFAEHAGLWRGGVSCARMALLFYSDQVFYEHPEHLALVHRLSRVFGEAQIPYDIVTERDSRDLRDYETVFAPALRYLSGDQIARLLAFAESGGRLVAVGPLGTEDVHARPRDPAPLDALGVASGFQAAPHGSGAILRLADADVPARASDFWCLMEERSLDIEKTRDCLVEARAKDLETGADLGAGFVARLEQALGLRLRWCPAETSPCVYLHAYRVPQQDGKPPRIVVHALNYNVPVLSDTPADGNSNGGWNIRTHAGEPLRAEQVAITVPLPDGYQVSSVETRSPVDTAEPVSFLPTSRSVTVTIPALRLYQAIIINPV